MLDPIAFTIFGKPIYWYGIYYAIGFLISYFLILHLGKMQKIKKEILEDIFFYLMIFSVLGGRIFFILFYNPSYYLSNPLQIFAVWNGGMSIHGGIIGAVGTLYFFSKKYKIPFLKLTDLFAIPTALGLTLGRLANFVNQELVGKPTTSSLGIVFPLYDNQTRWPTTLFESAKNMIAFQILLYQFYFKKLKTGTITATFLIIYAYGRFAIDFLREPTTLVFGIPVGQILNMIYGTIGVYLLYKINKK